MSKNNKNKSKKVEPEIKQNKNVFLELESGEQEFDDTVNNSPVINNNTNTPIVTTNITQSNIDDNEGNWTAVQRDKKKKSKFMKNNKSSKTVTSKQEDKEFDIDTSEKEEIVSNGEHLKFVSKWNVWVHLNNSTNWSTDSYKIVSTIENISSFWKFVNNIPNLDMEKYQFYIMKENSCPTWEHETNRNGGTCSIRLPRDKMDDVIEQLSILVLNDTFNDKPNEINGISFCVKINWGLIKIWNTDCEHDLSGFVPQYLTKKYSATPRYKKNEPEF